MICLNIKNDIFIDSEIVDYKIKLFKILFLFLSCFEDKTHWD